MKPGDALKTVAPIRSQKTGLILPREGNFVDAIENLGRTLILVSFGTAGNEYLFPDEVQPVQASEEIAAPAHLLECLAASNDQLFDNLNPHG